MKYPYRRWTLWEDEILVDIYKRYSNKHITKEGMKILVERLKRTRLAIVERAIHLRTFRDDMPDTGWVYK